MWFEQLQGLLPVIFATLFLLLSVTILNLIELAERDSEKEKQK